MENEDFWKIMCESGVIAKVGESLPCARFFVVGSTEGKTQEALRLVVIISSDRISCRLFGGAGTVGIETVAQRPAGASPSTTLIKLLSLRPTMQ